jgi:hypothetical protein
MMNTFQFISSVGGAGAPEGNKGNEGGVLKSPAALQKRRSTGAL